MTWDLKKTVKLALLAAAALLSVFVLAKYAASAEFHGATIASLDEKQTTVMELTAASTAASAAITLIPGDVATPIADKLADLSGYFLIVLCAIFLEKYLLTVTGYATFVILIPAACALYAVNIWAERDALREVARRLLAFGIAIFLVIPASVKVSDLISSTYEDSINAAITSAMETTEALEEGAETEKEDKDGIFSSIISGVQSGVSDLTAKVQAVLNDFIEALAVLLVTSCAIPILVLFFFVWITKVTLGAGSARVFGHIEQS